MLAIETTGLTKRYRDHYAVKDLNLEVPARCVYGFLGPNGAGKTTAMRLLLGLIRPDGGSVSLLGHDLKRDRLAAVRHVGAFVESPALYDHLSGRTNLDLTRRLLGLAVTEVDRVLELVDLCGAADKRAGTYSLGMKQRLALARALLGSPRLLLLDEPTNGLDPDGIIAMRNLIRALPDRIDGTVFMASHLLSEVEQTASIAGVMRNGNLVLQGGVRALLGDASVVRIELDDPTRGANLVAATGAEIIEKTDTLLRLRVTCDSMSGCDVAAINRLLVEAGIAVSAIRTEPRTLEQVYRDTVGEPEMRNAA